MKKYVLSIVTLACFGAVKADTIEVQKIRLSQPYVSAKPFLTDSTDVNKKAWDLSQMLTDGTISQQAWKTGMQTEDMVIPPSGNDALRLAGFTLQNESFAKANVLVGGPKDYKVFIDGTEGASQNLVPGRHDVVVRWLQKANKADTLNLRVDCNHAVQVNPEGKEPYTLKTLMYGTRLSGVSISGMTRRQTA